MPAEKLVLFAIAAMFVLLAGALVEVFVMSRAGVQTTTNDQNWMWDQRAWEQRILALTTNPHERALLEQRLREG